MNSSSKSRARRASLGGPATTSRSHFLKGVAVAALPNVLDLPDPPTPLTSQPAQAQAQPVQKKRRRRHSVSHLEQSLSVVVPSVIAAPAATTTATAAVAKHQKKNHQKKNHQNQKHNKPAHKKSKKHTLSSSSPAATEPDTIINNNNDEDDADTTAVDCYQLPDPLHPKEAPPANQVRGVLEQLRALVHAYTDARHSHSESIAGANSAAASADLPLQQLQQQIQEITSNSYVLTPPLMHEQVLLQSQQQQQLPSEYDRRLKLWMQLGPAMQQLDQHKHATAASVTQAIGLQVEKAPASYYSYYSSDRNNNNNSRRRRVAPETYQQRYYDMLLQQQQNKPDWGAYFTHLQTLDANETTSTTTPPASTTTTIASIDSINNDVNNNTEDSTKRLAETQQPEPHQISLVPPASHTKSEQSFDAATETSSTTGSNSMDEKLPNSADLNDQDLTANLKTIPVHTSLRPNTAMALTLDKENASVSLLSASTNIIHCSDSNNGKSKRMNKQQQQLISLPPRPLALAVPSQSRSLQDLTKTKLLSVEPSSFSSLVKPNSNNNNHSDAATTKVRSPEIAPNNVRAACHKQSPPPMSPSARAQESRTISNIEDSAELNKANDDDSTTTVAAFDLLPIPDRAAPSQHPEIAAAEERLFQALDVALDTYSREVTEIRQREAAAQQGGDSSGGGGSAGPEP